MNLKPQKDRRPDLWQGRAFMGSTKPNSPTVFVLLSMLAVSTRVSTPHPRGNHDRNDVCDSRSHALCTAHRG